MEDQKESTSKDYSCVELYLKISVILSIFLMLQVFIPTYLASKIFPKNTVPEFFAYNKWIKFLVDSTIGDTLVFEKSKNISIKDQKLVLRGEILFDFFSLLK